MEGKLHHQCPLEYTYEDYRNWKEVPGGGFRKYNVIFIWIKSELKAIAMKQDTVKCKELQKQYTPTDCLTTHPPKSDISELPMFYCITINGHEKNQCPVNYSYQINAL
jgi:hypothetical protein